MTQDGGSTARLQVAGLVPGGLMLAALVANIVGPGHLAVPLVIIALSLPGYALVRLARLRDLAMDILLGMVLSASLLGLTSLVQLAVDAWDPRATVGALLLVGIGAAAVDVAISLRGRSAAMAEAGPSAHAPNEAEVIAGSELPAGPDQPPGEEPTVPTEHAAPR